MLDKTVCCSDQEPGNDVYLQVVDLESGKNRQVVLPSLQKLCCQAEFGPADIPQPYYICLNPFSIRKSYLYRRLFIQPLSEH